MDGRPPIELDLDRRRTLRELLSTTASVYREHLGVVLASTGASVMVVNLIMGAGLHQITTSYQAHPRESATTIELLVSLLVLTPLVNATLALLLVEVARGHRPTILATIQRGLDAFAPALVAVILYAVAVAAGSLLIFAGVYLLVVWYFATQCVAVEGRRAFGALARSSELVAGRFFRVLATLLAITLLGSVVPVLILGFAFDAAARAVDAQVVSLVGTMILQTFSLSFLALAGGLLFFELRASAPTGGAGRTR